MRARLLIVLLIPLSLGALPLDASARRRGGRHHHYRHRHRVRLAMLKRPLTPAWTHSTKPIDTAQDAPDETDPHTGPGGIAKSRIHGDATRAACLRELHRLRIPFRRAKPRRGVWLPVEIIGRMHGVRYKALYTKRPPLVNCPFALGLERAARLLSKFGVIEARYTSTWRPPPRRSWRRIGHHPQGMAMDVNELVFKNGTKIVILKDWEHFYGGPGNCVGRPRTKKGALLRRMTCALEKAHIFRRIITPDSDLGHRNHWHFSGAQIGEAFTRGRWCGRTLDQPLPGGPGFSRWYYWYSCWKFRNPRVRYRCYRRRSRRKPRPPVRYKYPHQVPRVAIWLREQVKAAEPAPEPGARAVSLPPQERPAPRRRPRP